jgi:drug/metabolite transporter (DMT)-like permease
VAQVAHKQTLPEGAASPALHLNSANVEAPANSRRNGVRKTRILVLLVIATNVLGNVFLSHGMQQVGRIISASPLDYLRAFANSWTLLGICVLVIWMLSDLALLSSADLSFVLPVTASAYVLVALGGHFLLHDHISWARWTGILLITVGVILAEETPTRTTQGPPERLL